MIPLALTRLPWKLIGLGLLIALLGIQTLRLSWAERRADRIQFELNEARQALKDADLAARKLQAETERLIKLNRERQTQANDKAGRIERAPLPGNCKTPREILESDI